MTAPKNLDASRRAICRGDNDRVPTEAAQAGEPRALLERDETRSVG